MFLGRWWDKCLCRFGRVCLSLTFWNSELESWELKLGGKIGLWGILDGWAFYLVRYRVGERACGAAVGDPVKPPPLDS
jgi:hypothetical protein